MFRREPNYIFLYLTSSFLLSDLLTRNRDIESDLTRPHKRIDDRTEERNVSERERGEKGRDRVRKITVSSWLSSTHTHTHTYPLSDYLSLTLTHTDTHAYPLAAFSMNLFSCGNKVRVPLLPFPTVMLMDTEMTGSVAKKNHHRH